MMANISSIAYISFMCLPLTGISANPATKSVLTNEHLLASRGNPSRTLRGHFRGVCNL